MPEPWSYRSTGGHMKIKHVIDDHQLDKQLYARRSEGDSVAAICPKCRTAGALELDPHNNTYRCHACRVSGDAQKLDQLIRRYGIEGV